MDRCPINKAASNPALGYDFARIFGELVSLHDTGAEVKLVLGLIEGSSTALLLKTDISSTVESRCHDGSSEVISLL